MEGKKFCNTLPIADRLMAGSPPANEEKWCENFEIILIWIKKKKKKTTRQTKQELWFFHPRKVERLTSDLSNTLGDDELARREYSAYLDVKTIPFPLLISNPSARGHRPGYGGTDAHGG